MALKTDYKDAVWSGDRRVRITPDSGTVVTGSIKDITSYDTTGDVFGASDINATNTQVNSNKESIDSLWNLTESGAFTYEENFTGYGTSEKTLPWAIKCGRIVELYGAFKNDRQLATSGDGVLMGHVPAGFEPYRTVQFITNTRASEKAMIVITPDGSITVSRNTGTNANLNANAAIRICCTYIAATRA